MYAHNISLPKALDVDGVMVSRYKHALVAGNFVY